MKYTSIAFLAAFALSTQALASEVSVEDAWARATAPGQENGSVGLTITSPRDAQLIAVTTTASTSAEIHTMNMDNGVMKMRQIEALALPANQAVKLGPGGEHLMLIGLKKQLKEGDSLPLTLTVQFADKRTEKIRIKAIVKSLTGGNQHHQHH